MTDLAERRLTPQMRLVELTHGAPIDTLLKKLRREGLSTAEIGRRVGVPYGTVYRWLVQFGLDDGTLIRRGLDDDPDRGTAEWSGRRDSPLPPAKEEPDGSNDRRSG
ncbi:MAG: helix-turn-helix domain-containing protein [Candidatus Dormibacteraeota bacterium]|nr:helix-turn-helix domain-containing protein [Candidatus Dormibacteraeota bacterium]